MFMATGFERRVVAYVHNDAVDRASGERAGKASPAHGSRGEVLWPWFRTVLPADAHKRCSGRLFITITTVEKMRPRLVVCRFDSNEDLFDVRGLKLHHAVSRSVGGLILPRQRSFDGLFSENIPSSQTTSGRSSSSTWERCSTLANHSHAQ